MPGGHTGAMTLQIRLIRAIYHVEPREASRSELNRSHGCDAETSQTLFVSESRRSFLMQELLQKRGTRAHMQIMRLAINDCMTYDAATRTGGPTGAIRVEKAAQYEHNKGLADAVESLVAVKENNAPVTFSDVLQLACFEAATAGGVPGLAFIPGRRDSRVVAPASRLLAFSSILHDGAPDPSRIKTVAKRLGVPLAHVVALLGTHPFGAAWQDPEVRFATHAVLLDRPISNCDTALPSQSGVAMRSYPPNRQWAVCATRSVVQARSALHQSHAFVSSSPHG